MAFVLDLLPQLLVTGIVIGSTYGLIALCFYVVYAGTGVINFAQGDFVAIGLILIWTAIVALNLPLIIAIPATILVTALIVVALERVTINFVTKQDPIIPLLVTLALGTLIRGMLQLFWGQQPHTVPQFSGDDALRVGSAAIMPQTFWIVGGAAFIVSLLYYFFTRTMFGLAIRAASRDREGAQVIGFNVNLVSLYAFGLSALISGAVGALIAPHINADPLAGLDLSLKGFAGAVLGGIDKPHAALLGGLAIGVLEALISGLISSEYRNLVVFGVLMTVIIFRPNGLLGGKA